MFSTPPLITQLIKIPRRKPPQGIRHKFTKEEDEKLKELVSKYGDLNWTAISEKMPNRSPRQCRERYKNYLQPNLNTEEWSLAEEELLKAKYAEYGPKWAKISSFFTNRADVNIKNHWVQMNVRQKRQESQTIELAQDSTRCQNEEDVYVAPSDWYDPAPHWNFPDDFHYDSFTDSGF